MSPAAAPETLRPAEPGDAGTVLGLLADTGLLTEGVTTSLDRFVVAEERGRIVGVACLEAGPATRRRRPPRIFRRPILERETR